MDECFKTDVLIIGAGIAGGVASLLLAEKGLNICLINRSDSLSGSNTYHAQGGVIYEHPDDSPEKLERDILHAGAGHSYPKAVKLLASVGPKLVKEILVNQLQIRFDREDNGDLSLVAEASHSLPRIIHSTDATGKSIQQALEATIKIQPNITLLNNHTAVDLLTPTHQGRNRLAVYEKPSCVGAYVLDQKSGTIKCFLAKKTIIATGGLGQIFLRTTNPEGARGDGIAMLNRAGGRIINLEFIQFHPTTLFHRQETGLLISETARGAGARLKNKFGRYFMDDYDPEWKDLAPRDVVSRAIHQEILKSNSNFVYLDFKSFIDAEEIKSHFPNIYSMCLKHGIDITREDVPVVPAAHYSCGGIWVDLNGRTTIRDLYAIGEVSCTGVHGANRLASTSLLEGLVWAKQAADHCEQTIGKRKHHPAGDIPPWEITGEFDPDPALIAQDMASIRHIMWNYVGLVRNRHRLQRSLRELRALETEIERFYRKTRISDELLGLRNAVRTAIMVTLAAWGNRRSMGCHFRED